MALVKPVIWNGTHHLPMAAPDTIDPVLLPPVAASGTTVVDNINGTVTIDPDGAGATASQAAIRPVDELTEIGSNVARNDKFIVEDISAGAGVHRSVYADRIDFLVNAQLTDLNAALSPGGVIPNTVLDAVSGRNIPSDAYTDFNGGHTTPITLPVPQYTGQTFIFNHLATTDTVVNVTNTTLTSPLTVTAAMFGAEFVAVGGKWLLRSENPITTKAPNVVNFFGVSGTYTPTAGVKYAEIRAWGSGGGGGGSALAGIGLASVGGAGGGGAFVEVIIVPPNIGASLTIVCAGGGTAGAASSPGGAGPTTTVANAGGIVFTAGGGGGGAAGVAGATAGISGAVGGVFSSTGSVKNVFATNGQEGQPSHAVVVGTAVSLVRGHGGQSNGGRSGAGSAHSGTAFVGVAGISGPGNGAGASGGASALNAVGNVGGTGGQGRVTITEYF